MIRLIGRARVNCNWLQIMENSLDPVHAEWLHGHLQEFLEEQRGSKYELSRKHVKIDFDEFPYGIYKRRLLEGVSEESDDWRIGHPILFPNTLASGMGGGDLWTMYTYQLRVPEDDEHTMHYWYSAYQPPSGTEVPAHLYERVPCYEVPTRNAEGEYLLEIIDVQDIMAWETQGAIAARDLERLGTTDAGIIMYRAMLKRELERVREGRDPMGTVRDPAERALTFALERNKVHRSDGFESWLRRREAWFSPFAHDLCSVFSRYNAKPAIV
jgi:5,5'-dehydrodivanillate O-demethylase